MLLAQEAAREWSTEVPGAKAPCLDGLLSAKPCLVGDGNLDDTHPGTARGKNRRRTRAMAGDRRRTSWPTSLSSQSSFSKEFAGAEVQGTKRRLPSARSMCRDGPSEGEGLAQMHAHSDFSWRLMSSRPFLRPLKEAVWLCGIRRCVVEVYGCRVDGAVVGFSLCATFRDGSVEAKSEEQGVPMGPPVVLPFCWDFLCTEQDEAVVRAARVAVPGQPGPDSSNFPHEAGNVDLVERVFEVFGQEAAFFVVVVAAWPPPNGVPKPAEVLQAAASVAGTDHTQRFPISALWSKAAGVPRQFRAMHLSRRHCSVFNERIQKSDQRGASERPPMSQQPQEGVSAAQRIDKSSSQLHLCHRPALVHLHGVKRVNADVCAESAPMRALLHDVRRAFEQLRTSHPFYRGQS